MPKTNICTKEYKLADSQSIIIWDITSSEDPNFHFQLRFIQKNSQRINLSQLKSVLQRYIEKPKVANKLCFNKKEEFLNNLETLGFDLSLTDIIQNGTRFKMGNQSTLTKEHDKKLISLFCLESSNNFKFGYETPKDISGNNIPLCCALIFNNNQLSKKIYLFPTSEESLKNAVTLLKENPSKPHLEIPYVEYLPSKSSEQNYDNDIQTRINLQTIISEILTQLEKPKSFRKNGLEKANIFQKLAKETASNKPIDQISTKLEKHEWELLAQHRDPWGFFAFFKGKTRSLITWEKLQEKISEFTTHSPSPQLS